MALKYKRILLKISGEALGGEKGMGFDEPTMDAICGGVKKAHELGVQIGIVVGGGNFWRGRSSGKMERTLEMQATGLMEHAGWQKQMMIILG